MKVRYSYLRQQFSNAPRAIDKKFGKPLEKFERFC